MVVKRDLLMKISLFFAICVLLSACGTNNRAVDLSGEEPEVKISGYIVDRADSTVLVTDAESKNAFWFSNLNKDLSIGSKVEVTYTGPVLESYPAQANAIQIKALPSPKEEAAAIATALRDVNRSYIWMVQSVKRSGQQYVIELKNDGDQIVAKTIEINE
jgi:hypothetical protein